MLKLHHPAALIAGLVLCALSFIPPRKSQVENAALNNSTKANSMPSSAPSDNPPQPESQ